jgi:5-methylcytosine-specific restriction endonuclease McrA
MPLDKLFGLTTGSRPLTAEEGYRILERDHYRCRYCGLDGMRSFENSLIMTVDFVLPRARQGTSDPSNLVAACRPCNVIKGSRVFADFEEARKYVLQRREQLRRAWLETLSSPAVQAHRA